MREIEPMVVDYGQLRCVNGRRGLLTHSPESEFIKWIRERRGSANSWSWDGMEISGGGWIYGGGQ